MPIRDLGGAVLTGQIESALMPYFAAARVPC